MIAGVALVLEGVAVEVSEASFSKAVATPLALEILSSRVCKPVGWLAEYLFLMRSGILKEKIVIETYSYREHV